MYAPYLIIDCLYFRPSLLINAEWMPRSFSSACVASKYSTLDGVCNNVRHPDWGVSGSPFIRLLPPKYGKLINNFTPHHLCTTTYYYTIDITFYFIYLSMHNFTPCVKYESSVSKSFVTHFHFSRFCVCKPIL